MGWFIDLNDTEDLEAWIEAIECGFSMEALSSLKEKMHLSGETLARWLGTSERTLRRREKTGHLTAEESDRLFRLAHLFERTAQVLGSESAARRWLQTEQHALGGRVPLNLARYEPGLREVERLLGRLEHGISV